MKTKLIPAVVFVVFILGVVFLAEGQTGPGGVGNSTTNKIWLKTDAGILDPVANARVGFWVDQSGNNIHANQAVATNRPSYQLNGLNGTPYLHFDRTAALQYLELSNSAISALTSNSNTIFIVAKANSGGADNSTNAYQSFFIIPGYHSGIGVSGYPATTSFYMMNWIGGAIPGVPTTGVSNSAAIAQGTWNFLTRRVTEVPTGTSESAFLNGSLTTTSSQAGQMTNYQQNIVRIGAAFLSGTYTWALNGDIAEIIAYNKSLNEAERIIVENYLSAKYDYVINNDKFAYDSPNEYPYNVAGIGRYDASNTHTSANSDLVNVSNPSTLDDNEYVLLGHNNQPLLSNDNAPSGMKRLNRVWRVDVTGEPGTVSVTFNVNNFSSTTAQNFRLLVDGDGDFSNATQYSGSVSNNVFTTDAPVSLGDGNFVTLGFNQAGATNPIALSYPVSQVVIIFGTSGSTVQPVITDGGASGSFSLVNPPAGVSINTLTGVISFDGTTPIGNHSITVSVNNVFGSSVFNDAFTLKVFPFQTMKFEYASQTVSTGNAISPILPNLPSTGFQYSLASGSLNGLSLNSTTGEISGTLQSEGTISVSIRATPQAPNTIGSPITTVVNFTAIGSTGPAGVGNASSNKIWLDANNLTGIASGSKISTFADRSSNGWNAVQGTTSRKPTFYSNQLNGKPMIRFDRSSTVQCMELTASGIGALMSNSNTIFVIAKANTGGADNTTNAYQSLIAAPGYHSTIAFSGYPNTTGTFVISYVGGTIPGSPTSTYVSNGAPLTQLSWRMFTRKISESSKTIMTSYLDGTQMGNPSISDLQMTNYNNNIVRIGSATLSGEYNWALNGDIAEIIAYNTTVNEAQRTIIENYLSAKYALAIANDKYTLNDVAYIRDVEGIGTTDGTNANKHSISSYSKGLKLTELNSSLDGGGEFLFAGHASSTNAIINTELPSSASERWERVWYAEKTGSIDAKLSFDLTDAGLAVPVNLATDFGFYQLLSRPSTTGAFSVVPVAPALENGDQIAFMLTNVQLLNGYYTLGKATGLIWTGAIDQQWNQAGNWNLNRIPTASDGVIVNGCTTCPVLNNSATIASLTLNSGSMLNLANQVLIVVGTTSLNEARIQSESGILRSADFSEVKNSFFQGAVALEKTGGVDNAWYGGNKFSPDLRMINSSRNSWEVAAQSSNVIKTF